MIFSLVALAVIAVVVAMVGTEGLWSASLMLFNVLAALLLTMGLWEALAGTAWGMFIAGEFFWDFFAMGSLFAVFVMMFRGVTDYVAKTPIEFPGLVDQIGGYVVSAWTGWLVVCFLSVALQTAPLPREFLGFSPEGGNVFGLNPDRVLLGFTQRMSQGPFIPLWADSSDPSEAHVFDPRGEFIVKYATHRDTYASPKAIEAGLSGVMLE